MKPFSQGIRDFKAGQISNPFTTNTNRHRDWQFGFNKAYFENLARVKNAEEKRSARSKNSR